MISGFGEQFVRTGVLPRELGKALNKAFEKRQLGDYEAMPVTSDEDAGTVDFCGAIERRLDKSQR